LGLFENPFKYLDPSRAAVETYTPEHLATAREVARECMVLLKNDGVLPLKKDARVAVVGPLAKNASALAGCWSTGSHNNECVTLYDGIAEVARSASYAEGSWLFKDKELEETIRFGMAMSFAPGFRGEAIHTVPQERLVAEAVAKARQADIVIACVGETEQFNGEASSRSDISIPDAQVELLKALKATGKPVVMVLVTGRPLTLEWEDANMDAILCVWSPGSEGGHAAADILFGDANPSAKLTTSFPRNVGQLPLYYNHKNTGRPHGENEPFKKFTSCYMDVPNGPLYPFGYGLSYTAYEYGPVSLSASEMGQKGSVTASVTVTNTGDCDGDEIVQLYIHDIYATSTRPVKELKGFKKVHIAAGQSAQVEFTITADELSYYDHDLRWVCEPGDFDVFIGPDCQHGEPARLTVTE
jgi:beta-glucosidase